MAKPDMSDYVDVAERLVEFREKHPDGSLQQVDLQFMEFGGKAWVVYTAAAYRHPEDPRPGQGTAWEPVPGPTPYTKDSEVQNAETAAWGRAIVAALAADTKRGVASAQEVRNRQQVADSTSPSFAAPTVEQRQALVDQLGAAAVDEVQTKELCLLLSGGEHGTVNDLEPQVFYALRNVATWLADGKLQSRYTDRGVLELAKPDGTAVDAAKIVEAVTA